MLNEPVSTHIAPAAGARGGGVGAPVMSEMFLMPRSETSTRSGLGYSLWKSLASFSTAASRNSSLSTVVPLPVKAKVVIQDQFISKLKN